LTNNSFQLLSRKYSVNNWSMFNWVQEEVLPTITTDPVIIEKHRDKVITHQKHCNELIEILIAWWMDRMSAHLALPYVLQRENLAEFQKDE